MLVLWFGDLQGIRTSIAKEPYSFVIFHSAIAFCKVTQSETVISKPKYYRRSIEKQVIDITVISVRVPYLELRHGIV